jgi:hypothetical protein
VGEREAADVAHHEIVGERERGEERGEDQDVQDVALLARDGGRHEPRRRRHPTPSASQPTRRTSDADPPAEQPLRPPQSTPIMIRNAMASL